MIFSKFRRQSMDCQKTLEVLQAYLDGEVDEGTAEKVARHLVRCAPCERESATYNRIKASLRRGRTSVNPRVAGALEDYANRLVHDDCV